MARRDYYDWRGIAMLTQQLGQLFEPSKARLMSDQQEHEMNMLMAKKAWDLQSKKVTQLETELEGVQTETAKYEEKLMGRNLEELVGASLKDGANPTEAAEIREKTDIKKFGDFQDVIKNYEDMLANEKATQRDLVKYDAHALIGEEWTNSLTAKPTEKRKDVIGKNYKALHDADESGTLSWSEQNNALKDYIKDYYILPEGEEGMQITIGDETFNTKPEAHAFLAGFRHVRGRKGVDATEAAAQASKLKTETQYLNTMYMARKTIQDYEQRGMSKQKLALRKGSPYGDFTSADVDMYSSSHDLFKEAYKSYVKKGGIIPDDLVGVNPVNDSMFYNDPEAWFNTDPKEFASEGLTPEKYEEIQNSDNKTYKEMAFKIVYNWDDIMKTGSETEKNNMLKSFGILKNQFNF